ncbi:MAG TPA: DUF5916 domain-containing protein, partial [Anaerolineae bacterium]|nr:DUF5916 domain-containing protein [Anaerolineae bacterium]
MSNIQSIISLTIFLRLVLLINLPVFAEQINMNQQSITAYVIDSPIKLDGLLNEPAWKSAELITGFTQKEPREGTPATEKTEVRILYDEDNLYVGVICFDSEPEKIIYKDLKRDSGLTSDDKFTFILDTYYDKRMGYYFSTNPNGVRYDATFMSDMGQNSDWDEIWDVSARIMDYGWSCEFVIPFKSLRFPAKETQIWGINFLREIRRKHEEAVWRSWRRNEGVRHLSQAGTLLMTGPLHRGKQINFKPYLLSGAEKLLHKDIDNVFKYGLDVKIGITSNTTVDLTTNTDFAHIESDRDVINLTRFDIYYPEKRDFFLEGSETFDFTQGGTRLFYSRRIGISPDRQELPIMGGVKLTQKTGTYRLGMLSMQTKEKHGNPGTNYSVIRVKKDVLEQSYVGFIVTSVFDADHHDNQVYGMDWGYKTDKLFTNRNFEIQGYITGSVNDGSDVDNLAGRIYMSYPNDFINLFTLYHALDDNFKPGLGFVRRVGIKNYMWNMSINPRPSIPFIQKLVFIPCNLNYNTDMDGKLVARTVDIRPFGFTT